MISITPVEAFNDNYHWLIHDGTYAAVVDPGDPKPVQRAVEKAGLKLVAILITHHHWDHTGGIKALKAQYGCEVFGPLNNAIEGIDNHCVEGTRLTLPGLNLTLEVMEVPGHTKDHIAYFAAQTDKYKNLLFCGDTVFSGGCGRLFEGTAAQMWQSIQKIMALPDDTLLFPAHEYTLSNIQFALAVEPNNQSLQKYNDQAKALRNKLLPTLPAVLATEKAINPFMRADDPDVVKTAETRAEAVNLSAAQVFAVIRHWKDTF
ncbi:hydroxyacylglutathione hydrolase [Aliikangiella marina]|nr:hydroxyacylglutathione hydrolase [Aliikangiella marina]